MTPLKASLAAMLAGTWREKALQRIVRTVVRHLEARGTGAARPGHVLMCGPSGSGKSALTDAIAASLSEVPVATVDVSLMTCTGYAGLDPVDAVRSLVRAADFNFQKAQRGVLVLENIDRLNKSNDPRYLLQEEFLDMLDGRTVELRPDSYGQGGAAYHFNMSKVLVIASGRFDGIGNYDLESFVEWGLLPAFAARLPSRVVLAPPDFEDLLALVRQQNSPWSSYAGWLARQEPVSHEIADDAAEAVARLALQIGMGAWGVAHAVERIEARVAALQAPTTIDATFIEAC